MSRHDAEPHDRGEARARIEELAADNDVDALYRYLTESGTRIAASAYVELVAQKLALQRELIVSENAGKRHRVRAALGGLGLVALGAVGAFGYASETVNARTADLISNRNAITEPIPPEAAVYIPGAVKRSLDQNPDLKELPVVPTAAWCEPSTVPDQQGILHYDVVINPKEGAGIPDPTPNSEYCPPNTAIIPPMGFAEQFDLDIYTFGK